MRWEGAEDAAGEYWVGRAGKARFQIGRWVKGWGATLSYPGDSYGILESAKTIEEAKQFCEFVARQMGFEK